MNYALWKSTGHVGTLIALNGLPYIHLGFFWPPGAGRHWPQLTLRPWASNSQISHFIINGFAGHAITSTFPSALLLMAFLNCCRPASLTMRYKYLIPHLESAIYHL